MTEGKIGSEVKDLKETRHLHPLASNTVGIRVSPGH